MARLQPPVSLEALRALLDRASARRSFLTDRHSSSAEGGRSVPYGTRCRVVVADVDGDYVAAIIGEGARLDTGALAEALGGKRAQLVSPRTVRAWLGSASSSGENERIGSLTWDEVPLITQLPTVIDRSLLEHSFLLGGTGDPECLLRIAPGELRRVTAAVVAPIGRAGRSRTRSNPGDRVGSDSGIPIGADSTQEEVQTSAR
ncbi:MAG: aminoacyl-tRNA deacylase [Chloroflexota bacterium]